MRTSSYVRPGALDDASAEAAVTIVEDGKLAGSNGALRFHESHLDRSVTTHGGVAGLIRLSVTDLDATVEVGRSGLHQPVARPGEQRTTREQWMVVSLHGDELVAGEILGCHIPGIFG